MSPLLLCAAIFGAMLALMSAPLAPGADAQAVLAGWQQATLAHVPPAEPVRSEAWRRSAWLPLAGAQSAQWQGRRADGQTVAAQAVWGAFAEGDHVRVVHGITSQISHAMAIRLRPVSQSNKHSRCSCARGLGGLSMMAETVQWRLANKSRLSDTTTAM